MKKIIAILFIAWLALSGCSLSSNNQAVNQEVQTSTDTPILGGDADEHGCIGSAGYTWCEEKNKCLRLFEEECKIATSTMPSPRPIYLNEDFGFSLTLEDDWHGYSVQTVEIEYGHKITLRHPKWTLSTRYEDIPILAYPLEQWKIWETNDFDGYPTAAPIGPTERGRNNAYVLATAPRYNYDFSLGYEEVENIIQGMTTFDLDVEN